MKFPNACIRLAGNENAYEIIARVETAMRRAKIAPAEFEAYRRAAMSGDYENLLPRGFACAWRLNNPTAPEKARELAAQIAAG